MKTKALANVGIVLILTIILGTIAFPLSSGGITGKLTAVLLADNEVCYDSVDNDGDALIDCLDIDCNEKACDGTGGCLCINRQAREVRCWDGKDNDGNGLTDLGDPHCILQS